MKPQEIFDTVATHLFNQGKQSYDNHKCLYRGPNGTKCAVGCLLPDRYYQESMDWGWGGMNVRALIERNYKVPTWFKPNVDLLYFLQLVHDDMGGRNWKSTQNMKKALNKVAVRYNLSSEILKNLKFKKTGP